MYCRNNCGNNYIDLCTNRCCQFCCSDQECYIHHRVNFTFFGKLYIRLCKFTSNLTYCKKKAPSSIILNNTNTFIKIDESCVPLCKICFEKSLECAFGCGHCLCFKCSELVKFCPYCDRFIESRLKLYFC